MKINYLACLVSFLLTFTIMHSALALPGQKVSDVVTWSENHPLLEKLLPNNPATTCDPDYFITFDFNKEGTLSISIWSDADGNVLREKIDYLSNNLPFYFKKDNAEGINIIKQVYGPDISNDFETAQYVSSFRTLQNNTNVEVYQGQSYFYLVINDPACPRKTFSVVLPANVDRTVLELQQTTQPCWLVR